mmetsp:Transcript_13992/g.30254  ORF Transcript_13992/g.30254 Transcript_13992/m.30254 type:complete len:297 (-) Transcript_13992:751-1641(-)|eukprot:CAMPEP_0202890798 /NCGR_PEP_ID=MMETSP1392-20130828/1092_1 /ASSEMBLY_ACC=CAM_ASM_000868 /TAXON_ID=225041 /ORGANISM="Chlamydomonas chlamydogama, Strain SAG 11-48b" /LENGTH=296 /DNA_ID=CAMNT_0049574435 /DNA_START=222 /DNA_END=1112 /DNA_ORIENTATION=+
MDSVVVQYVVPSFGNLIGVIMLLSPIKAVWNIRKEGKLGDINPLPYPMTAINCLGWVIYGAVVRDPLIIPANIVGVLFGMLATTTAYPACSRKMQDVLQVLLAASGLYYCLLSILHTYALDAHGQKEMWGLSCVLILMIYYTIPLSTLLHIIRTRNAASIYLPLAATAILNGGLWTIYGLAVQDINIWGPNVLGVALGVVQVVVRLMLGAKPLTPAATSPDLPNRSREIAIELNGDALEKAPLRTAVDSTWPGDAWSSKQLNGSAAHDSDGDLRIPAGKSLDSSDTDGRGTSSPAV